MEHVISNNPVLPPHFLVLKSNHKKNCICVDSSLIDWPKRYESFPKDVNVRAKKIEVPPDIQALPARYQGFDFWSIPNGWFAWVPFSLTKIIVISHSRRGVDESKVENFNTYSIQAQQVRSRLSCEGVGIRVGWDIISLWMLDSVTYGNTMMVVKVFMGKDGFSKGSLVDMDTSYLLLRFVSEVWLGTRRSSCVQCSMPLVEKDHSMFLIRLLYWSGGNVWNI